MTTTLDPPRPTVEERLAHLEEGQRDVLGAVERQGEALAALNAKVDRVDGKVDRIDGNVDQLNGKVNQIGATVDQLAADLASLAGSVAEMSGDLAVVKDAVIGEPEAAPATSSRPAGWASRSAAQYDD